MMRSDISTIDKVTIKERYDTVAKGYSLRDALNTFFLLGYDIEMGLWGRSWWSVGGSLKGDDADPWWARSGNSKGPYTTEPPGNVCWRIRGVWL